MQRVTITNRGLSLLASSSEATGQYYWLGYYALAYVPSIWKNEEVEFPSNGQECLNVNGEQNIESTDTDQISPAMTRLTKYGDMIYNIWQGSSAKTATANPEEPTSFYTDIKRFYRYVLDENGNNTLVAWTDVGDRDENGNPIYIGKHVYRGTDGYTKSTMYIPAPLYYLGDTYGKLATSNYFKELPSFEETSGTTGNGSDIYPYMEVTLDDGSTTLTVPEVTTDYRAYRDSAGTESSYDTYNVPSQYFNSKGILPEVTGSLDSTSWVAAKWTLTPDFNPNGDFSTVCSEFWKLWSISNYNRYNAPAGSIGTAMSSEFNTRNFSKLTKFFPIESYNVVSSQRGISASGGNVEVATALKLGISINLSSRMENDARQYDRTGMAVQHPTVLVDGTETPNDESGKNIFESTHVSFKFNRIGIYAVPVMKAPVVNGKGSGEIAGKNVTLQYQIDPDGEPVLFAVIDWDNTITLSDTGDGIHEFEAEFNVNLEAPDGSVDSSLVRDTSIFYNIYQTPELKWYQNQLIATASTANAITEMGLELAAMRTRMDALSTVCCALPEKSDEGNGGSGGGYGLRNLKDAANAIDGGLRGVDTLEENDDYAVGIDSIALGTATGAAGKASSVLGGKDNIIDSDCENSAIVNGLGNEMEDVSESSIVGGGGNKIVLSGDYSVPTSKKNSIIGGTGNLIDSANESSIISSIDGEITGGVRSSSIIGGLNNKIQQSIAGLMSESAIIAGSGNVILADAETPVSPSYSAIIGGLNNTIRGGFPDFIIGGIGNVITNSGNGFIAGSYNSTVLSTALRSGILSSTTASINGSTESVILGGGALHNGSDIHGNHIYGGARRIIIGGLQNCIHGGNKGLVDSTTGIEIDDNAIVGGHSSTITGTNSCASILSGHTNTINGSTDHSTMVGGYFNSISGQSSYGTIISGQGNAINGNSIHSTVIGGYFNVISNDGTYNGIFSGNQNCINEHGGKQTLSSVVLGGHDNSLSGVECSSIVGGHNNYIGYKETRSSTGSIALGGETNYIYSGDNSIIGSSTYIGVSGDYITVLGSSRTRVSENDTPPISASGSHSTILGSHDVTSTGNYSTIIGSSWVNSSGSRSVVIGSNYIKSVDNYELVYSGYYGNADRSFVEDAHSSVYTFGGSGAVTYQTNYCYSDVFMFHPDGLLKLTPNSAYSCVATVTGIYSAGPGDPIADQLYNICGYSGNTPGTSVYEASSVVYTKIFAFTIMTNSDGRITMTCSSNGSADNIRTGTFKFYDNGAIEAPSAYTATRGSTIYAGCAGWQPSVSGWENEIYVYSDITPDSSSSTTPAMNTDTKIAFRARFYLPGVAISSHPARSMFARVKLECEKIVAIPQTSN